MKIALSSTIKLKKDSMSQNPLKVFGKEIISNRQLYLMALPAIIWFAIFSYYPLLWLQIAFKDYNIQDGAFGSPFLNDIFENFKTFMSSIYFGRTTFNTIFLNSLSIFFVMASSVLVALLLNEMRRKFAKKIFQSVIFLPYFLSTIIISSFVYSMLGDQFGTVNSLLKAMGSQPIAFYSKPEIWPAILTAVSVWQGVGFNSVIYLSAITSIDLQLYEAVRIDGGSRWHEMRYITIPHLLPTVCIMLLLSIGKIFSGNFSLIFSIIGNNGLLLPTTDILDTYVYRGLMLDGTISQSTAVGLYQSVMGFIVVVISNKLAKKYDESYGLF